MIGFESLGRNLILSHLVNRLAHPAIPRLHRNLDTYRSIIVKLGANTALWESDMTYYKHHAFLCIDRTLEQLNEKPVMASASS